VRVVVLKLNKKAVERPVSTSGATALIWRSIISFDFCASHSLVCDTLWCALTVNMELTRLRRSMSM